MGYPRYWTAQCFSRNKGTNALSGPETSVLLCDAPTQTVQFIPLFCCIEQILNLLCMWKAKPNVRNLQGRKLYLTVNFSEPQLFTETVMLSSPRQHGVNPTRAGARAASCCLADQYDLHNFSLPDFTEYRLQRCNQIVKNVHLLRKASVDCAYIVDRTSEARQFEVPTCNLSSSDHSFEQQVIKFEPVIVFCWFFCAAYYAAANYAHRCRLCFLPFAYCLVLSSSTNPYQQVTPTLLSLLQALIDSITRATGPSPS